MSSLECLRFGQVLFADSAEYSAFQCRQLCIVLLVSALVTGLLLLGVASNTNRIDSLPEDYPKPRAR